MKNKISALLLALAAGLTLTACAGNEDANTETQVDGEEVVEETGVEESDVESDVETGEIAKIGLGVSVNLGSSSADGESANAQSDATIAGVAFDADGKIVKVIIDTAQNKVQVNDGVVEAPEEFKTKKELGPDYNMKPASGIDKEWDEQIEFLEEYFVGMTADEVMGIEVDEDTYPTDADVLTGATIKISSYQNAVANAWENAVDAEGVESIGLGVHTSLGHNTKDAEGDEGAAVQFEDNIALVGLNADNEVVASQTDVAQNTVSFTADGQLDGEYAAGTTKKTLGAEYGMKAASEAAGIGKEWDEQAQAYDEYLVGKDADAISNIELDEKGKATDADLVTGATITIDGFIAATEEALENVK